MGRERTRCAVSFLVVACSVLVADSRGADPPKPDAKPTRAEQHEYLPLVLQKAVLGNEFEYSKSLEHSLKLFEALRESGAVSPLAIDQVEEELIQTRIRLVRREADYRGALDRFKLRFELTPERLQKAEEVALGPLTRHLRRLDDTFKDSDAVRVELTRNGPPDADKLRPLVRRSLTESALAKDTQFGKQFATQWDEWEKRKDLEEPLGKYRDERGRLLARRSERQVQEKPFPPVDAQRLEEIAFQIDLAELERSVRAYEREFGKGANGANRQLRHAAFRQCEAAVNLVLQRAVAERLAQFRRSWPAPGPVRVKEVDVLACDLDKAEQVVGALFKQPDGAVAGKEKLRKVRALAETYRLQQRLFEISSLRVRTALDVLVAPPEAGAVPAPEGVAVLTRQFLGAQRSLSEVTGELCTTWVAYQAARFDLYRDFGLPPP